MTDESVTEVPNDSHITIEKCSDGNNRVVDGRNRVLEKARIEAVLQNMTHVGTLYDLSLYLCDMGLLARFDEDGKSVTGSVSVTLDDKEDNDKIQDFVFMVTAIDDSLQFDCQLCTVGDLPDDTADAIAWLMLAVNTEIQPFSVGLINPDGILDEDDVLVLTNSVSIGDFDKNKLQRTMDDLRRGLVAVMPLLSK